MPSLLNRFKRFLHNHSHLVDFLSASLIISLCLIILLPKVHESFQATTTTIPLPHQHDVVSFAVGLTDVTQQTSAGQQLPSDEVHDEGEHHGHHHDHKLPIGEVIICAGFFVFYCIGLGLTDKLGCSADRAPLLMAERKISTVCCTSTRCPSSQLAEAPPDEMPDLRDESTESPQILNDSIKDDDCVLLLNRHHNHHTHSHHHEHSHNHLLPHSRPITKKNYGSTSKHANYEQDITPDLVKGSAKGSPQSYVGEIRITRRYGYYDDGEKVKVSWPLSIRVTLFGLLLASALILFDLNIHGLLEAIKVFRAAATGALLYVAFFLVMPKGSAGCNSCTEEEV